MTIRALYVAAMLFCLPAAGCGTAVNLVRCDPDGSGKRPFGGVQQDRLCIQEAASGEVGPATRAMPAGQSQPQVLLMLLCAADLPLSLIGDVVTLPYTCGYSWINQPTDFPPISLVAPPPPAPPSIAAPPVTQLPAAGNPQPAPAVLTPPRNLP